MDGWVKTYRSLAEHELWLMQPFTYGQAFLDLVMLANHKPGTILVRGIPVRLERGQVGWSEVSLATRWQWSRGKVRRYLGMLWERDMVDRKQDNKTTVITIKNYSIYQDECDLDGTANGTAGSTADGQQTDSRRYTNKNDKNEKKEDEYSLRSYSTPEMIEADHSGEPFIPLVDGTKFYIDQGQTDEWQKAYPAIDVIQELRKVWAWCDANPQNRKTRRGAKRFLNSWLSRAQDKAPRAARGSPGGGNGDAGYAPHIAPRTMSDAAALQRQKFAQDILKEMQSGRQQIDNTGDKEAIDCLPASEAVGRGLDNIGDDVGRGHEGADRRAVCGGGAAGAQTIDVFSVQRGDTEGG